MGLREVTIVPVVRVPVAKGDIEVIQVKFKVNVIIVKKKEMTLKQKQPFDRKSQ